MAHFRVIADCCVRFDFVVDSANVASAKEDAYRLLDKFVDEIELDNRVYGENLVSGGGNMIIRVTRYTDGERTRTKKINEKLEKLDEL